MKVLVFTPPSAKSNFGDALNQDLWGWVLPPETQTQWEDTLLLGIGTVLNSNVVDAKRYVVCGAGVGYGDPPKLDSRWSIYCVRGPRSGKALNAEYITDPAVLVGDRYRARGGGGVAFMPRWDTMGALGLGHAVDGVPVINPQWPPAAVLGALLKADLLVTEALHGAVVADALRVPWVPVVYAPGHAEKWHDWCESMDMEYDPFPLVGKSLTQAVLQDPKLSDSGVLQDRMDRMHRCIAIMRRDMSLRRGPFA